MRGATVCFISRESLIEKQRETCNHGDTWQIAPTHMIFSDTVGVRNTLGVFYMAWNHGEHQRRHLSEDFLNEDRWRTMVTDETQYK